MHTILPYDGTEKKSFTFYRDGSRLKDHSFSEKNNSYNQNYSLNFKHSFEKEEHELIFDVIYLQATDWLKENRNFKGINAHHRKAQLDYTLPLSKGAKLENGLQYRRNSFSNDRHTLFSY
ncbi:hypothetical protein [Bacteroidetes bacterium endosymbiont of Geopemphigus sp.]|uniref:hypothetical protein n=1 Tax=Bacteroidetes bacterium endosymbiont of Geopemphigus sp. TaxID=2047937 RepID=UPI000CD1EB86|nr:hypothetical protein [Bacteroidetes bacterium endosymbiont of Geopemphigus sp.]